MTHSLAGVIRPLGPCLALVAGCSALLPMPGCRHYSCNLPATHEKSACLSCLPACLAACSCRRTTYTLATSFCCRTGTSYAAACRVGAPTWGWGGGWLSGCLGWWAGMGGTMDMVRMGHACMYGYSRGCSSGFCMLASSVARCCAWQSTCLPVWARVYCPSLPSPVPFPPSGLVCTSRHPPPPPLCLLLPLECSAGGAGSGGQRGHGRAVKNRAAVAVAQEVTAVALRHGCSASHTRCFSSAVLLFGIGCKATHTLTRFRRCAARH